MPIQFDLSKYNNNNIFIETGTYKGEGVQEALRVGFKKIYSIELDITRFNSCTLMFKYNENVTILHGDSSSVLPELLKQIDEPATLWIDAHYCADGAEIGDKWSPLKEELEAIKNHKIKNHTILIDDWRCMENIHIDYTWATQNTTGSKFSIDNKNGKEVGFLGKTNCYEKIKEINSDYKFTFENGTVKEDVLVCKI